MFLPEFRLPKPHRTHIGAIAALCATAALLPASAFAAASAPGVAGSGAASGSPAGPVKAGVDAWGHGDYATAIHAWQGPAAAGDPDAEFDLGQAYKLGHGVPQDLAKAEQLFGAAAAQGHIQAGDNYGLLLFQRGEHVQAMPYVQAAAGRGDPRAEYLLGIAYFNADTVGKDWVRAYALESLAQQSGLPQAKTALAQMDTYVPLEQRQQGVAMASDLAAQAQTTRSHQLAAADLGATGARPSTQPAVRAPVAPGVHYAEAAPAQVLAPASRPAHVAVATPVPAPVRHPAATPAPAETPTSSGGWKLQLGAFGVPANAEAQWSRVKTMPGVAGHSRQMLPTGKVTRLMATGYSEAAARAACAKLSAAGTACIATKD